MLWAIVFLNNTKEGTLSQENCTYFILNKHTGNNKDDYPMFNKQQTDSLSPSSLKTQFFKLGCFFPPIESRRQALCSSPHSLPELRHFLIIARCALEAWRDARTLAHCEHLTSDLRKWWKINGCRCAHPAVDRCSLYTPFRIPQCVWLRDDEYSG